MGATYAHLGVSNTKTEVAAATARQDKGLFPDAFCQVLPDVLTPSKKHGLIIHADGAGTKSALAYLLWKETGDVSVFEGLAFDSLGMNIDDMMCVGATGHFIKVNTIGRNAKIIPGDVLNALMRGYERAVDMLHTNGVNVLMGGGETADVGDLVRTLIVDSTLMTRIPLSRVIDCSRVRPGHMIVAFASDGQATYEDTPNSGMGSNGLTAARHLLFRREYAEKYPETFASEIAGLAYRGRFGVTDPMPGLDGMTVGEAVLSPTRIYAPVLKQVIDRYGKKISAIFHNTGGGQAKCLKFGNGVSYNKVDPLPLPPLFQLLQQETGYSDEEMVRTFNLGSRMEVVCLPGVARDIIGIAESFNIRARLVGTVGQAPKGERRLQLNAFPGKPPLVLTARCAP